VLVVAVAVPGVAAALSADDDFAACRPAAAVVGVAVPVPAAGTAAPAAAQSAAEKCRCLMPCPRPCHPTPAHPLLANGVKLATLVVSVVMVVAAMSVLKRAWPQSEAPTQLLRSAGTGSGPRSTYASSGWPPSCRGSWVACDLTSW